MSETGLVLASASEQRRVLLAQIGVVPVSRLAADLDETQHRDETPRHLAARLARAKAAAVAARFPDAFVLAADTVVAAGRRILPKPADAAAARATLALLSGRRHQVFGAVALRAPDGRWGERLVESRVAFARLDGTEIDAYVASGEWRDRAGGYAIQGRAGGFVRFLSGSYSNVVGLPLFETRQLLRGLGWRPRDGGEA
jgi:septum formation protein